MAEAPRTESCSPVWRCPECERVYDTFDAECPLECGAELIEVTFCAECKHPDDDCICWIEDDDDGFINAGGSTASAARGVEGSRSGSTSPDTVGLPTTRAAQEREETTP